MSQWKLVCLLCDSPNKTLLRLKPHKLYACAPCIKDHGGREYVAENIDTFTEAFRARQMKRGERLARQLEVKDALRMGIK